MERDGGRACGEGGQGEERRSVGMCVEDEGG